MVTENQSRPQETTLMFPISGHINIMKNFKNPRLVCQVATLESLASPMEFFEAVLIADELLETEIDKALVIMKQARVTVISDKTNIFEFFLKLKRAQQKYPVKYDGLTEKVVL